MNKTARNILIVLAIAALVAFVQGGQTAANVAIQAVTLGRDYGNSVEVISGLNGGEQIIVNPPDSIENGQTVRVARVAE